MNADLVASSIQPQLRDQRLEQITETLAELKHSSFITHVHIYRYEPISDQIVFYTSYNRTDLPPLPARIGRLNHYMLPQVSDDSIELVRTIRSAEGATLGYVYVRTTLHELTVYTWRTIGLAAISILVSLLVAALLANWMRSRITRPLRDINDTVRTIARNKNYDLRLPPSELAEIDEFSTSMNSMLDKLQRQMQQSERARAQHAQITDELEQQIAQRTKSLKEANEELIRVVEELHTHQHRRLENERLASMTDLVAGIAHELNTPIGLSITAASLLEQKCSLLFPELAKSELVSTQQLSELKENVDIVQRNLRRAGELVGSFRRVAFEHAKDAPKSVNLNDLADNVINRLSPMLANREHYQILVEAPEEVLNIRVRPLESILTELLENAVYHGFHGRDEGIVNLHLHLKNNALEIRCADNGVGMSEEMTQRIFEPFMTSCRGSGHPGLGMHFVYNLVTHVFDGTIECQSYSEQGTTIVINLPIRD